MKKGLKIVIFILIFFILFCGLGVFFNPTGTIMEWFQSYTVIEFYKERKNSIDVLYVGNSCIYTGVSPMEVYKNTGITGYAFSTSGQRMVSSYYFIKEAFKYQKPKLVFLEIGEAFTGIDKNDEMSIRRAIDSLKFSKNKLDMIWDEDYQLSSYDKLSCIFPILRFHSRWNNLDESDLRKFVFKGNYTDKGYLLEKTTKKYNGKVNRKLREKYIKNAEEDKDEIQFEISKIPGEVRAKIDKMIEYCKQNDCELIFIKLPEPIVWNEEKHCFQMWYAAGDNYEPDVLFYAESKDGDKWIKHPEPILTKLPSHEWEKAKVGGCDVKRKSDGTYEMYYIGYQNVDVARICYATSKDGIHWDRTDNNLLIAPSENGFDSDATYKPAVLEKGNRLYMWYNGRSRNEEYIGLATKEIQ